MDEFYQQKAEANHYWKSKKTEAKRARKASARQKALPALVLDLPQVARDSSGQDRPTEAVTHQLEASLLFTAPQTLMAEVPSSQERAEQRKTVE